MSVSGDQEDLNNSKRDPLMDDFMEAEDGPQPGRETDDRREDNTESREDHDVSETKPEETKESQGDEETRSKKVFVGNLSFKTSSKQLKEYMGKVGEVIKVDIFEDKNGNSKGFGLVEFANADDVKKAVSEMNQTPLDGRQIFVREDNPNQARSGQLRIRDNKRGGRRNSPRRSGSRQRRHSKSRSGSYERRRHRNERGGRNRSKSRSRSPRRRDRDDYGKRRRSGSRENRRRSRSRSGSGGRNKRDRRSRSNEDRKSKGGHQVMVKNMPWSVTWQQLKDAFKEYGSVIRAEVPQDGSGRSKGYGYVKFEKESEASKAIGGMDGASFNGRKITVKMYND